MDPRRYRQQPPTPPQVINLVDYEIINLVDDDAPEQKINWLPRKNHQVKKIRADDTSTIASEITQEYFDQRKIQEHFDQSSKIQEQHFDESRSSKMQEQHFDQNTIQRPVCDAIMCAAETFMVQQSRDEMLLLTYGDEELHYVEDREQEPQLDFDCHDPSELWFGCLMDAAGDAAQFLTDGLVGASNLGHQKATDHLQRLEDDRKNKERLDAASKVPRDIPEVVDLCDHQDQDAVQEVVQVQQQQEQDDMLMMLPKRKKEDPPASKRKSEEETFPILEIHVPDTAEDDMTKL